MSSAGLDPILLALPPVATALESLRAGHPAGEIVLARPGFPWLLAALSRSVDRPILAVVPADEEARDLAGALAALVGRGAVALWPTIGTVPGSGVGAAPHLVGLRARALAALETPGRLVVASVAALAERAPAPHARAEPLSLATGETILVDDLAEHLFSMGYERVAQVEERGDIAARGGIVDCFPSTADTPVRIELFGDEVEAIRAFSPFTQRAIRALDRVLIWPANEPDGADRIAPLDDPAIGGALVIRLAPHDYGIALAGAAERLEDERAAGALVDPHDVSARLAAVGELDLALPLGGRRPAFDAAEARFPTRGLTEAQAELRRQAGAGRRVVVTFDRRGDLERAERQLHALAPHQVDLSENAPSPGRVSLAHLATPVGLVSHDLALVVAPAQALLRRHRPVAEGRLTVGRRIHSFLDLRVGDHVVHGDHGVGRLVGFETRTVANVTRDYLALAFAGSDQLFVPHDQLGKVTRYVGSDGTEPTLSRLGGKAWDRLKTRARAAVREMAGELIALYEARSRIEGHAFPPDDELVAAFERSFPHEETVDQERAIDEVASDMESPRPMDRLICGDVGFGKTEVAMRAAFKAAASGKQVLVLAPTTILAQQHLSTFRERMSEFPLSVDMVNRYRSPAEIKEVLTRFREGKLDILIGTHRVLAMDVQPKDLGLVVLDEEQRFGVAQKEALRRLRTSVDVLAMSATPIPRTLQMSLSGLRDISVIETPPRGRMPVATHIGQFDEGLIKEALEREAARKGQSFYLHNRVETIDEAADLVRGLVPGLRVLVAHGRMPEHQLEEVMRAFVKGDADVLVATSIIESGLDIPQANTLIVDRADRLGLSQLYQIRGRVGRSDLTAHAYLLYPDESALTHDAAARLRALADYTELGSGLRIAMRDLEIRGAGNLLGDEQSGHVAAVGFELYVEMLQEAIAIRYGDTPPPDVRIELPVSAHIPSEYVPFEAAKIDLHRRISQAGDPDALERLRGEVRDRFGEPPPPVEALLRIQGLKLSFGAVGVRHLAVRGGRLALAPLTLNSAQIGALREDFPRLAYNPAEVTLTVPVSADPEERLDVAAALSTALGQAKVAAV